MKVELTDKDIETIESWYQSAAGESATSRDAAMFDLLERLGIDAASQDLRMGTPENWTERHRPVIEAENAAVTAYIERHPERREELD